MKSQTELDWIAKHNERVKLRTSFFNTVGIGLIGFGFLRPLAEGTISFWNEPLTEDPRQYADIIQQTADLIRAWEAAGMRVVPDDPDQGFLGMLVPDWLQFMPSWVYWIAAGLAFHAVAVYNLGNLRKEKKS
ncbi:hypothetical protein [Pararhodobacter aggregans]|uniref:Uncharacterized protein n=1 Tax=Pararhodobacter aggregans TaxID=404875 RepID=A0A2T7URF5_9RHOB|nr:hypothetical protein [Pararhodobacter aggregans]PVE47219.1 hypothetical protein DDE23_13330 [Pararhodobacter aggregans]